MEVVDRLSFHQLRDGVVYLASPDSWEVSAGVGYCHAGYAECGKRIPTGILNETDWLKRDGICSRRWKAEALEDLYATQQGTFPPTFDPFCEQLPTRCIFLRTVFSNQIRKSFQFTGTPLAFSC